MNNQNLKDSILQLAIQGKLVEQRKSEEHASTLVKKIRQERQLYIQQNSLRKEKKLALIEADEIPHSIPETWEWMKFGELGIYKKGPFGSALTKSMFVPQSENTIKIYEQKNAIYKDFTLGEYYIPKEYFEQKLKGFEVFPGDVIVSCAGTIGETYILPENIDRGIINQALMKMTIMKSIYLPYLLMYFDFILKKAAIKNSKGSAIKNIPPFDELKNYPVPIPPFDEQIRIVNKLEELLPEVEIFNNISTEINDLDDKFPKELKRSILQYAVKGKLVEQLDKEGTAQVLSLNIQQEKERLIKESKIKRQKYLSEVDNEEIPFDIPKTWKWVRFGDIVNFNIGKTPPRNETKYWKSEYSWVSIADMINEGYVNKTKEKVSDFAIKERFKNQIVPKGTLIMSFKLTIGKISILNIDAVHNEAIISIYPFINNNNIMRDYLFKILPFMSVYGDSKSAIKGNTLNKTSLNNLLIPLPPLEEQKRIITKIDELLLKIDTYIK